MHGTDNFLNAANESSKVYVSIPFINEHVTNRIKRITAMQHVKCEIARTTNSNRSKVFSKLKDKKSSSDMKYSAFSLRCQDCNFEQSARTINLDLERTIKHIHGNIHSVTYKHVKEYGHWTPCLK